MCIAIQIYLRRGSTVSTMCLSIAFSIQYITDNNVLHNIQSYLNFIIP